VDEAEYSFMRGERWEQSGLEVRRKGYQLSNKVGK
jgi:hypothetical protein